jgi:hypothetical protein
VRITICVVGSRGDVQPAMALARRLGRAGHDARLFTHAVFEDLVRGHGVEFVPLIGDPRDGLTRTAVVELGRNPVRFVRWLRQGLRPHVRDLFRLTLDAATGSDALVVSSLSLAGFHVAERLGIPAISLQLQPVAGTREFAGSIVAQPPDWHPLRGAWNRVASGTANQMAFQLLRPLTSAARKEVLGLPPLGARYWWDVDAPDNDIPTLFAWSPAVLSKPADWGPSKHVTGYLFLDAPADYGPPADLASFLERGPPPVYVGLGSIIDHEGDALTRIVIDGGAHRRPARDPALRLVGPRDGRCPRLDPRAARRRPARLAAPPLRRHGASRGRRYDGGRIARCSAGRRRAVLSRPVPLGPTSQRAGRRPAQDPPQTADHGAARAGARRRSARRHDARERPRARRAHRRGGRRGERSIDHRVPRRFCNREVKE